MLDMERVIEMLKAEVFLEMVGERGDTDQMDKFVRLLVRNGCPFAAVIKSINELTEELQDGEDK